MPNLRGTVITADALHLQDETIAQVVEDKDGHMLIGLKGNRDRLLKEVIQAFDKSDSKQVARDSSIDSGHGRIETRIADVISFQTATKYPYISTAVRVDRERIQKKKGRTSQQISYYVGTFKASLYSPKQLQKFIRGHWAIENKLHHVKDRTMQEDRCQARANVGSNMAILRSAVVMIKAEKKKRIKTISARLRADLAYTIKIIKQPIDSQEERRIE